MGTVLSLKFVGVTKDGEDRHVKFVSCTHLFFYRMIHQLILSFLPAICTQRCHHGGHCVEPDICNCTGGWEGSDCSQGTLTTWQISVCAWLWFFSCYSAICTPPCQNGRCYRPDHCQCQRGWTGLRCDQGILWYLCISHIHLSTCHLSLSLLST